MWKSYKVHYKNKYPNGKVLCNDSSLDVFDESGEHCVRLELNGSGQILDVSEENGLKDRHDLSPIPKESRAYKLYKDGKIGKSEEYSARKSWADDKKIAGKILSMVEYEELPTQELPTQESQE